MKYCPLANGICQKKDCALYINTRYGEECALRAIGVNALEQTIYRNLDGWTELPDLPDYAFPEQEPDEQKESVIDNE